MQERLISHPDDAGRARRRFRLLVLPRPVLYMLVLLAAWLPQAMPAGAAARDDWEEEFEAAEEDWSGTSVGSGSWVELPRQRTGIQLRTGHLGFRTFGREESISHVELFPYILADDQMWFADMRLFLSNRARLGGNAGLGYRRRVSGWDRVFGGSLWYDGDDSTGSFFQQIGLSLETYGEYWDLRSNLYFPILNDEKQFGSFLHNQRFAGHHILFDQSWAFGKAMRGVDAELGLPLPTDFARRYNLRIYGGGYHFQRSGVPEINGYKGRFQADLTRHMATQVEFTRDGTFGTNVMLGVSLIFPGGFGRDKADTRTRPDRMGEFVQRNYNVIVSRHTRVIPGMAAVNPATDQPYTVQHVSAEGSSDGTIENPYRTVAQAQEAGGDIIFVHAGGVFDESIVLQDGERLLGEGETVDHFVAVDGFGDMLLPRATSGHNRPVIRGTTGDAVTLASHTVFSGFSIDSPDGHGIVGDGVRNARVMHTEVKDAAGSGVSLHNTAGNIHFENTQIGSAVGTAFHVDGGAGQVRFEGAIRNGSGRALVVENTTGGIVDLTGSTLRDNGGEGLLIANADGNVIVDSAVLLNGSTTGIDIQDGEGNVTFKGTTRIDNPAGRGVSVVDHDGETSFERLDATTGNNTGLFASNSGLISIDDGDITSVNAAAVDVESTPLNVVLTSVSSDGAPVGVRLVDSDGHFIVSGEGTLGSGGLIENSSTGVYLNNAGIVALRFLDLDGNGVGIETINTDELVLKHGRVTNSTQFGIDSLNTGTLEVSASLFEDNGGANSIRSRVNAPGNYVHRFVGNGISDSTADAISIESLAGGEAASLNLTVTENSILTSGNGHDGVNVSWDGSLLANFVNNSFRGTGGSNHGINIAANSETALAQVVIAHNAFVADGGSDTGIGITTRGPSQISINNNLIEFNGANGTGMNFDLAASAQVDLFNNVVNDRVSGGTGILFTSIEGPSHVRINNNALTLSGPAAITDRGIIFSSVDGTVELFGDQNNKIESATIPFFAPVDALDGHIIVNDALVP